MRQAHSHERQRRASGLVPGMSSRRARPSRRSTLAAALAGATALLTLLIASSAAHGAARDVSATHAYLRASYALARVAVARIPVSEARIQDFNRKLAAQCPQAGRGTPINEASQPMSYEVAVALWSLAYGADAGPIRKFLEAVKPLKWSSPRISRAARSYADELNALATLPLPDLCTDVRAWTASGFQTIPANVAALDRRVEAIEPQPVPNAWLAPSEQGADAAFAARTRKLEKKLSETEFEVGQDDWIQVTGTLGLPL
jgi:hypothetical protein